MIHRIDVEQPDEDTVIYRVPFLLKFDGTLDVHERDYAEANPPELSDSLKIRTGDFHLRLRSRHIGSSRIERDRATKTTLVTIHLPHPYRKVALPSFTWLDSQVAQLANACSGKSERFTVARAA